MTTRGEEVRGTDVAFIGSSSSSYKGSSLVRLRETAVLNMVHDYIKSIHSSERLNKEKNCSTNRLCGSK